jgi:hypothetical protein
MPKWSKDATEFEVNVHYNEEKGSQVRIPKPILQKMDNPDKVKFVIDGRTVKMLPVKDEIEQARLSLHIKRKRNDR